MTIADGAPHLHRDSFRREQSLAVECLVTLCLSGPAAEEMFYGPITDGGDLIDIEMARDYLRERYTEAQLALQLERMQLAAERLVASERARIEIVADALMRHGTLSGNQITKLLANTTTSATWIEGLQCERWAT